MLKKIRQYCRYGFVLLLPAYFFILSNSIRNKHTHILPNGIVITHAHPLPVDANGNKQTNHNHSRKSLALLYYLSIDFYVATDNFIAFQQFEYPFIGKIVFPNFLSHEIYIDGISERAPPVLS